MFELTAIYFGLLYLDAWMFCRMGSHHPVVDVINIFGGNVIQDKSTIPKFMIMSTQCPAKNAKEFFKQTIYKTVENF